MDKPRSTGKVINSHFIQLEDFVKKILQLKPSERRLYFQNINNYELDLISEIISNFLEKRIPVDYKSFTLLQKIKTFLRDFIKLKKSQKIKRRMLQSLKGLHLISILFPIALNFFMK